MIKYDFRVFLIQCITFLRKILNFFCRVHLTTSIFYLNFFHDDRIFCSVRTFYKREIKPAKLDEKEADTMRKIIKRHKIINLYVKYYKGKGNHK